MGWFNRLKLKLTNSYKRKLLLVGLDSAGKTTFLYQLQRKNQSTKPTLGYNAELIHYDKIDYIIFDVAGQEHTRTYWRHYYHGTDCIIYIVDCSDNERLQQSKSELYSICSEAELENVNLCVIANKIDLPNAINTTDLSKLFELDKLNRRYHVQPCIAVKGQGINDAMKWIQQNLTPIV